MSIFALQVAGESCRFKAESLKNSGVYFLSNQNQKKPLTDQTPESISALGKSNQILFEIQNISTSLFEKEPEDTKAIFDQLLQSIGRSIEVSRAYIFEAYQKDGEYYVNQTNEWVAEGIEPQIDNPITHHVNMMEIGLGQWQKGFLKKQVMNNIVCLSA